VRAASVVRRALPQASHPGPLPLSSSFPDSFPPGTDFR
jgi:hypothetical protein